MLSLMDTVVVILGVLRIILGFLLLVVIPGFALSLVLFPRLTDLSMLDRLVYAAVLGITSAIAFIVFMDLMPGLEFTLENLIFIAGVFSAGALMVWLCERWYLNRRLITHPEPQISEYSPDHQRYYSREINAAKDQFRQDTRTVVVYHESERLSGMNFVSHSYLLDVAEEIDIQQVVENRVKGTESFILESPYPKTRYFELILLEHDEGPSSLVDDLQIYPVHVTTKPDTKSPGTTLQRTPSSSRKKSIQRPVPRRSSGSTAMISTFLRSSMQRILLPGWLIGSWGYLTKLSLQQKAVFVSLHLQETGRF